MATGATTSSYIIPIGRRIQEILDERGAAYLIGFFANRIQFDPRRLVSILQSERNPTSSDLEQIAKGLGIPIERLTQQDTLIRTEQVHKLLQTQGTSEEVIQVAEELASVAQGATERCDALNNLGKAYYLARRFEEAYEAFTQAYTHYNSVMDQHRDYDRLFRLFNNLIAIYTVCKDTDGLAEILEDAEAMPWPDLMQTGAVFFASAVVQFERGCIENARQRFLQSLTAYRQSGDSTMIGNGEYNLGRLEYLTGHDSLAIEYLQSALLHLSVHRNKLVKIVELLAKALIQLHKLDQAQALIDEYIDLLHEHPRVLAMLYLQHAYQLGDPDRLAQVLTLEIVEKPLKASGYMYLMRHFSDIGDSVACMNYFRYYLLVDNQPSSFKDYMQQRRAEV